MTLDIKEKPGRKEIRPAIFERQRSRHADLVALTGHGPLKSMRGAYRDGTDELSVFAGLPPATGTVVAQLVFGGCGFHEAARERMAGADWPLLWIEGDVCPGTEVSATQAFVIDDDHVRRIELDGRIVGSAWSDDDADYCLLAGVLPADPSAGKGDQTTSCFERIEAALGQAGMEFSHVVRTWLYLDQLLSWYDEFNKARTAFFHARKVFDGLIPASTGIGGANPAGAALAAAALAIRPRRQGVRIQEIVSPLQCAATDYRSSFSRAVEIGLSGRRWLLVSGTASIAPGGESLHTDDVAKQIHLTLDVVEALLHSRDMDWTDTTRAVGYFRDIRDLPVFEECCRERGIPPLPMAPAHAIVCRDDLLFELELDALAPPLEKEMSP